MDEKSPIQLSMEDLNNLFSNFAGELTKQLGMDRVDRKHGIFPDTTEEQKKELTKDERLRIWLRAITLKDPADIAQAKTVLSYTSTAGLGFVPEEFRTEVVRVAENYGVVRRFASVYPTSVSLINLHQANGVITAYWITDQTTAITESEPTFTEPTIAIEKCATISSVARELLADATFPVVRYISELAGEALAGAEDTQGLIGTGSPYHGLVGGTITGQNTVTSTATSYLAFSPEDMLDLAMSVAEKYRKGGMFFMHPTVLAGLTKAFKNNDADFILRTPREDGLATSIWGYPVVESEKLPSTDAAATKFIGFANPKRLFFFDRQQMEVATSDSANLAVTGSIFQKDLLAIRVLERVGMGWMLGAGTAVLKTATV